MTKNVTLVPSFASFFAERAEEFGFKSEGHNRYRAIDPAASVQRISLARLTDVLFVYLPSGKPETMPEQISVAYQAYLAHIAEINGAEPRVKIQYLTRFGPPRAKD